MGRVYRGPGRFGEAQPLLSELTDGFRPLLVPSTRVCWCLTRLSRPIASPGCGLAATPGLGWGRRSPIKDRPRLCWQRPTRFWPQVVVFGGNLGSCYWERRFQKCHFWNPPGSGSVQEVQVGTGVLCIEKAAPKKLHISQHF